MNKKSVRDVDLKGKRVLVRVDFNVPTEGDKVTDDTRIRAAIPTLKYILEQKPKAMILMSHLGRPKGEDKAKDKAEFSLKPVVPLVSEQLGVPVAFAEDCIGEEAENAVANLPEGGVVLLENTRFYKGESKNDPKMAEQLAKLGDLLVNDAFGTAHRAHASNVGLASHMESVAGFLLEKEIDFLVNAIENPKRPFVAIMGGAKISDKVKVIESLLQKVDKLLIGGGMSNTFLKAQGIEMGDSLVDAEAVETAKAMLAQAGDKLVLPVDSVIADKFDNDATRKTIEVKEGVPAGWQSLDIGPKTIEKFNQILAEAKTVIWNGPVGVFEMDNFAVGTNAIAHELAKITEKGAVTIIGGGDSAAAISQAGLDERVTHVSTGGGASLELLEGQELPGVTSLADKT